MRLVQPHTKSVLRHIFFQRPKDEIEAILVRIGYGRAGSRFVILHRFLLAALLLFSNCQKATRMLEEEQESQFQPRLFFNISYSPQVVLYQSTCRRDGSILDASVTSAACLTRRRQSQICYTGRLHPRRTLDLGGLRQTVHVSKTRPMEHIFKYTTGSHPTSQHKQTGRSSTDDDRVCASRFASHPRRLQ